MTAFTMPHWSDPRVQAVALAIYDDNALHTEMTFPRDKAVEFWPGLDARRFVAMMDAYLKATSAHEKLATAARTSPTSP